MSRAWFYALLIVLLYVGLFGSLVGVVPDLAGILLVLPAAIVFGVEAIRE